jgi:hypothetical protein
LLAVAQCRVEDVNVVRHGWRSCRLLVPLFHGSMPCPARSGKEVTAPSEAEDTR